MSTIDDKITALETKLKQAKAQKQQVEARQRTADSKAKRTADNHKKILIGAAILSRVELNTWPIDKLNSMMDSFLTRPAERALFDLPLTPTNTPTTTSTTPKAES